MPDSRPGKNNNGAAASFLAPSVDGQAEAIALAQSNATFPSKTIGLQLRRTAQEPPLAIRLNSKRRKVFESKTNNETVLLPGSIKGNIGHPPMPPGCQA